jgi:polygalacturonase
MKKKVLFFVVNAVLVSLVISAMLVRRRHGNRTAVIEKSIQKTSFPNRVFNILDYGAVANDTTVLNHEAINRAILACSLQGGGKVVVPVVFF